MLPLADHNPVHRAPIMTWIFIGICIVAFIGQMIGPNGFGWSIYAYGFIPARLFDGATLPFPTPASPAETLLTSMFLHGSIGHIFGNMLYLWVFGDNIENDMGRPQYLVFYLLCGLLAAMAQGLTNPASTIPMVGASGAISGVLGAYIVLHPKQRITVLLPMVGFTQLPALVALGFWFAYQLMLGLATPTEGGGIAFWAHIGGFVAGVVLVKVFMWRPR